MWRIIKFIFIGKWDNHSHQWEEIEQINIFGNDKTMPKAFLIILKCKHCGDIKQRRVGS